MEVCVWGFIILMVVAILLTFIRLVGGALWDLFSVPFVLFTGYTPWQLLLTTRVCPICRKRYKMKDDDGIRVINDFCPYCPVICIHCSHTFKPLRATFPIYCPQCGTLLTRREG